ncbi:unnamed protein product [Brassicogethes aeneus]|uniref:Uncharacterized protein n=1 Tax=Brassicogethes aeneus TaxID=1431903 RepID=A0A9P0FMC2_BRAAE|nr:unnamed protein product [Brassicogethes aeneus]
MATHSGDDDAELKSLVRQRAHIKSRLTRFTNYLNELQESELDELLVLELETRLHRAESLQSEYETVQNEIEAISEQNIDPELQKNLGQDHVSTSTILPESFELDGADREENALKRSKTQKKKILKLQRNMGQEYVRAYSKKFVSNRCIKARCQKNLVYFQITDEERREIFEKFNGVGGLHLQRKFLARHIKVDETRRKTTDKEHPGYSFTVGNKSCRVCNFF